jgi:hypothetical protein
LVDACEDAIIAQTVGEAEHATVMLRAVVAVADEDPWRSRFRHQTVLAAGD